MKLISLLIVLGAFSTSAFANSPEDVKLQTLLDNYSTELSALDPFSAPSHGEGVSNPNLGTFPSESFFLKKELLLQKTHSKLDKIDYKYLSPAQRLDFEVFQQSLTTSLKISAQKGHRYMNLSHMGNRLMDFIQQADPDQGLFPFNSMADYNNFAYRMNYFKDYVKNLISFEREGIAQGYRLSCYAVNNLHIYLEPALEKDLQQNPFWKPMINLPESFTTTEKESLQAEYKSLIQNEISQAYTYALNFLKDEYSKSCNPETGLSALPNGSELYKNLLESEADTTLDPKVIHEMGLTEVARIKAAFEKIQTQMGFQGTLKEFLDHMRNNPENYFTSADQLVARFEELKQKVMPLIPDYFEVVPQSEFKIETIEQPGSAYARFPTELQPVGAIVLETGSLQTFPKFTTATLFLHEGMPGHVLAGSLRFENKFISNFRRNEFYSNAFDEGWALYSESLGYNMGLYEDPYSNFGHLADDMLRAIRLVVDTGLHSMNWTRNQAVQYMDQLVPYQLSDTENEIDRYLAIPAQAVGYKIGQFKILELRNKAQQTLGSCFNLKRFHSAVLAEGIIPLSVLDKNMTTWISSEKQKCDSNN